MAGDVSPYASAAPNMRENGYHVMPVSPGTKIPGEWTGTTWRPMSGWQKFCDTPAAEFIHDRWENWPDAGICVAHGAVIGLDLDTDRDDVKTALMGAVEVSPVLRRGQKGWLGYYRPGDGLDDLTARVRWYDPKSKHPDSPVVELLLHGTQSVVPPTVHPGTGQSYRWLTDETLETMDIGDLPEFTGGDVSALDRAFRQIGLEREKPRKVKITNYVHDTAGLHDLEKPWGRSLNDRALEPDAIDRWFPALGLAKTRQRGPGAWEAVPEWRGSSRGRAVHERNPNLRIVPTGARDFGGGVVEGYTALDLVAAARDCTVAQAGEWLEQYVRPEEGATAHEMLAQITAERPQEGKAAPAAPEPRDEPEDAPREPCAARSAARFAGKDRRKSKIEGVKPTSEREFADAFPGEVPPFPVQDFNADLSGLLREATLYIDEAANMRSEQGAFAAALVALGAIMGRTVEVIETGLRTNLYVVGTAASGAGKSSAMTAMSEMMDQCGVGDLLAGSDFTSGAAILKEMNGGRPQLFNVDEFGDVIRRALAARAASHERDIGRILKDMYSSAGGIYRGKSYATVERQDIIEPHLCLYGVSTHERFWEGLDAGSFSDGLLARFIMIPIGATETQRPQKDRIEVVKDMITDLVQSSMGQGNLGRPACRQVYFEVGVWDQWMSDRTLFQRHALRAEKMGRPGAPSIIQRICENAMKIAMISAMGNDPHRPVVSSEDYELGLDVAHWSAIYMMDAIDTYYVENASHRDLNRVLQFIEGRGAKGCTRRELYQGMRGVFVNGPAAKGIMEALKTSEAIIEWVQAAEGRGRPTTWFVATQHAEKFFRDKGADSAEDHQPPE